jgi:L-lysine exporter family protein LysE/ArgO
LILIFLGIFLFQYFGNFFNSTIEFILNILLFIFLVHFIYGKISVQKNKINFNQKIKNISLIDITTKTLAFTYLNPHVYSDTVFFLGNFSKNFLTIDKYYFGIGASIASFLFFFTIGYLSKFLSKYLQSALIWKKINLFIILFMSIIALYVLIEIVSFI